MNRITLFKHNAESYNAAVSMLLETGKAAVVHPTGTGKSFIGFKLAEDNPESTVCWLSPSEYIFKTQIENLKANGADKPENIAFFTYAKLMLMSDEELAEIKPDYIILDEFHRCGAEQWGRGVQSLLNMYPDASVLGLSATNIRYLDNQRDMADELFDGNIASEMTLGEAIVRGILAPPKYVLSVYSYQKDLDKYTARVKKAKNRLVRDAAEKYLDALRRALENADGIDEIFSKHMTKRAGKYIVFCSNAEHMDEMIDKANEWFGRIDSNPHIYRAYSDDPETDSAFAGFKADASEHLKLLYCIDMLNEGVHVDDVDGVILFRPTVSPIIYKQQIGRALSAGKAKEPIIFDIVNNFENLYSIGAVEEEMQNVILNYRSVGMDEEIVNESFKIFDEVRECRRLFDELEESLSSSWDMMYSRAKRYYEQNGNLIISDKYKTEDNISLGAWVSNQRRIRAGRLIGNLTEQQIEKLDAIGMIWSGRYEVTWERNFTAAVQYYEEFGNLDVPMSYADGNGIELGRWILCIRQIHARVGSSAYLTEERINLLDRLGMIWNKNDYAWERNYCEAVRYYQAHGDLNVPVNFISNGVRLGEWLCRVRRAVRHGEKSAVDDTRIGMLNELQMQWKTQSEFLWDALYKEAAQYFAKHGNLGVSAQYRTDKGHNLYRWLRTQRSAYACGKLSENEILMLEKIGMVWVTSDWEKRFALAKGYYDEHGNIDLPCTYKLDGIDIGRWLSRLRLNYAKNRDYLSQSQIDALNGIGMDWHSSDDKMWDSSFERAARYAEVHGNLDCEAAYKDEDGYKLGAWIFRQRANRDSGALSEERIDRLDKLGMVWSLEYRWEKCFQCAKQYYEAHGDLNVMYYFCDGSGFQLGMWICQQRSAFKSGRLSKKRIDQLNAIGMLWEIEDRWEKNYQAAKEYYHKNRSLMIHTRYVTDDGINLGVWIAAQRAERRKNKLSDERIRRLNAIGMVWNAQGRNGTSKVNGAYVEM